MTNKEKYKKVFDVLTSTETFSLEENVKMNKNQKKSFMAVAVTAAIAVTSITACAAAYINWSKGLTESLRISEEQQKELEESGIAVLVGVSSTDTGVTVTAQTCITDNYFTYLSFKVEGYELQEGTTPFFEKTSITVDDRTDFSWSGSFYDGLITGSNGRAIYADGTPIDYENTPLLGKYVQEDGSLEYHMILMKDQDKGFFIGKTIHVELENLGSAKKTEVVSELEGKWELEWTLGGADTSKEFNMNDELGDTGAIVKNVELSPISIKVLYQFPRTEIEEVKVEDGIIGTHTTYAEAPDPAGVRLKDGTLLTTLCGGPGSTGYVEENSDEYRVDYAFDQVINVDDVEAVLYRKSCPEEGMPDTIDNFYVVELNKELGCDE